MNLTPETLSRHELVGLDVAVTEAANPACIGIRGRVVRETKNTLEIRRNGQISTVPKEEATFTFDLPAGERTEVTGTTLVARPARRTEQTGNSQWH